MISLIATKQNVLNLSGLKSMVKIYEDYNEECHILFDRARYKLLCYNLLADAIQNVTLCGTVIDILVYLIKKDILEINFSITFISIISYTQ